jgi:hypothetical protein
MVAELVKERQVVLNNFIKVYFNYKRYRIKKMIRLVMKAKAHESHKWTTCSNQIIIAQAN